MPGNLTPVATARRESDAAKTGAGNLPVRKVVGALYAPLRPSTIDVTPSIRSDAESIHSLRSVTAGAPGSPYPYSRFPVYGQAEYGIVI